MDGGEDSQWILEDDIISGDDQGWVDILGVERSSTEDVGSFVIRRNAEVASFKREGKINIRARWALKLASWVEHIYRHPEQPAFALLDCQNDLWLWTMRALGGNRCDSNDVDAVKSWPWLPYEMGFQVGRIC